jgi:hypothetical protein
MLSKVLRASPQGDPRENREDWIKRKRGRVVLRRKLLTYFSLGLVVNFGNSVMYTLVGTFFARYYVELSLLNGARASLYLVLNLYFLDVLRDGVITPAGG